MAELALRVHRLQIVEPPIELPGFDLQLVWHRRNEADPAHRWLRDRIRTAAEDIEGRPSTRTTG